LSASASHKGIAVVLFGALLPALREGLRRRDPMEGAHALDSHFHLADRLASALAFHGLPRERQTAFMVAAMEDAEATSQRLSVAEAVPLRVPQRMPHLVGAVVFALLVGIYKVPPPAVPVPVASTLVPAELTTDDLDAYREFLSELKDRGTTEDTAADIVEFNQLLGDLAAKRLDRSEAFRRIRQLEDKLLEGREGDPKAMADALAKMGEELKKSEWSKPAGEALETKNLAKAEQALKDLAKRLREQKTGADKAQVEALRQALQKASESSQERLKNLDKRRDELKQELLRKKEKAADGGASEAENSLLKKKERELERLDREREGASQASRQLDRLDRELAKAAEDLARDLGLSAEDLEQGAEDLNRMSKSEMTQEEKEQLRQKLQELRETLRQQGSGSQPQISRLRRFQQAARGQRGGSRGGQGGQRGQGGEEESGASGQGSSGQTGPGGQEGEGAGEDGQNGQGEGKNGQGDKGKPGESWVLGPQGQKMLVLSGGGSGSGSGAGGGGGKGGKGYGSGHDGQVQGKDGTNLSGSTQDTQVAGQDTGQGGSRSEVIQGAAERGFASRGYQKVYREYQTVAEEALGKDEIPGGYRFYVRRYFQLIRPREGQ
jgi:hypothetical protein